MNIFHKLDIHYPGTDIRAAAQGSRLGEGGCSLLPPPTNFPAAKGAQSFEGSPLCPHACRGWWGYLSPIFLLPVSSSPLTLKPLLLPAPGQVASRQVCAGREDPPGTGPRSWGRQRVPPDQQERGWDGRGEGL